MSKNKNDDQSPNHKTRVAKYQNLRSKINNSFLTLDRNDNNSAKKTSDSKNSSIDYFDSENYLLLSEKVANLVARLKNVAPYFDFTTANKTDSVENSLKFLINKNQKIIHSNDIKPPNHIDNITLNKIIKFQEKELLNDDVIIAKNKELSFDNNLVNLKHIIEELINNSTNLSENILKKRNELLELLFNIIKEKESKTKNIERLSELKKRYYGLINLDTRQMKAKKLIDAPTKQHSQFIKNLFIVSVLTFICTIIFLVIFLISK